MPSKDQLHQLVDRLPDSEIQTALKLLAALQFTTENPVLLSILTAPPDDEPYTEEQQHEDEEAHARIQRGEGIPHDEILKEFGLL